MRSTSSEWRAGAVAMAAGVLAAAGHAMACGQPPVVEPPKTWQVWGGPGSGAIELYVELGTIFPTTSPHACSCGLGLGAAGVPLPFGVDVNDIQLGKLTRINGEIISFMPIGEFDAMGPDANATNGWQAGPGGPLPGIGQPQPGSTWFGLGGLVPPVEPGALEPGQHWVICFDLKFEPGTLEGRTVPLQIGAGLGISPTNFSPLFDPQDEHSARYSEVDFDFKFVPSPGSLVVLGMGGLVASRRRRETAGQH